MLRKISTSMSSSHRSTSNQHSDNNVADLRACQFGVFGRHDINMRY